MLEHSLREEVTNTQQMTIEKQELEMRVTELETRLEQTRYELTHMQVRTHTNCVMLT